MLGELPAKQTLPTFHLCFTVEWYLKTKVLRMAAPLICFSLWLIADARRMRARQTCMILLLISQPPALSRAEASSTSWGFCVFTNAQCVSFLWLTIIGKL